MVVTHLRKSWVICLWPFMRNTSTTRSCSSTGQWEDIQKRVFSQSGCMHTHTHLSTHLHNCTHSSWVPSGSNKAGWANSELLVRYLPRVFVYWFTQALPWVTMRCLCLCVCIHVCSRTHTFLSTWALYVHVCILVHPADFYFTCHQCPEEVSMSKVQGQLALSLKGS